MHAAPQASLARKQALARVRIGALIAAVGLASGDLLRSARVPPARDLDLSSYAITWLCCGALLAVLLGLVLIARAEVLARLPENLHLAAGALDGLGLFSPSPCFWRTRGRWMGILARSGCWVLWPCAAAPTR